MKLVTFDKEKLTLELAQGEFYDILMALHSVIQDYETLARTTLRIPLERIDTLCDDLSKISGTQSARFERDSASP